MKITTFFLSLFVVISFSLQAQSNLEPALAYNLLKFENSGRYVVIGNFKVVGNPYLFGGNSKGAIFAKSEYDNNLVFSYNLYNQDLEFNQAKGKTLVKNVNEVDSFILKSDGEFYLADLFFINASFVGLKDKCFLRVVSSGPRFNLYKKYSSVLEIPTTNYVQPELRQFALKVDYYYMNNETRELKKIRINKKSIINEFKPYKDFSELLHEKNINEKTEEQMIQIFNQLNG